jgi:hypothetical protein
MHARNVYIVLNLVTGCDSSQYHCHFNNFFETMCHIASEVSGTICWQQLANLDCAKMTLVEMSMPKQHSIISLEMPSDEESHTMSKLVFEPTTYDTMSDYYSVLDMASQVSENSHTSLQNWASCTADEVTPVEPTVTAVTSQRGQVRTMPQRMVKSVSQRNFYRDQGMHYMASQATTGDIDEDLFHDAHLQLQEQIRDPIAFHAEMMGGIIYLEQALKEPNAKEFVQVVIKEVTKQVESNNWTLWKQSE